MNSFKNTTTMLLALFTFIFTGCNNNKVRNIPAGYIGKILTPSGWEKGIKEAGQIDIGLLNNNGMGNSLVLLEATSVTMKESFGEKNNGKSTEDHRIMTLSGTPISVDIYNQLAVSTDLTLRNELFAMITPTAVPGQDRVSVISISDIYGRFAMMSIRGKTREIFAKYKDYDEVMANYSKVNAEIAVMVAQVFEQNKVPLTLISTQLSNVKPDDQIWQANNKMASADAEVSAINKVGEAMKNNPGYLQFKKWETIEKISGKQNLTIIVGGENDVKYTLPIK